MDGDPLSVIALDTTGTLGTVTLNDNGTPGDTSDDFVEYTPPAGYVGSDSFGYTISSYNFV